VARFDELAEGVNRIAEAENLQRFAVVGQSAGGVLAQVLLRKYPAKIDRAVFAHTTAVTSETSPVEVQKRVAQLQKRLRLMQWMPFPITKRLSTRGVLGIVETMSQDEFYFWKPYFTSLVHSRTKSQGIAMMQMLIDFAENYRFTAQDLDGWAGKIMVLDSDADAAIPQMERENVRKLYPGARMHTFQDLGHLAILSERRRYLTLIREFLSS
jgi:pimeloyl-ACP methyl ester carboxylesterase